MHDTKLSRAWNLSGIDPMVMMRAAIGESISPVLIERLTAAELAEVIRSLDIHWRKAVAHAEQGARAWNGQSAPNSKKDDPWSSEYGCGHA